MSICLDPVNVKNNVKVYNSVNSSINVNYVLKSRENISKSRCRKVLKRKLKKYKLRKDGKEDQEILDVSQVFITSLRIKSPKDQTGRVSVNNIDICKTQNRQGGQIHKMGRRKKEIVKLNSSDSSDINASVPAESEVEKQDKKQMDAFKMLMDSRNKVIGCNSPGKDKKELLCNDQDAIERKEMKAKRLLSLQKMALSKGAVQQQEREELRETYVRKKMVKRAERLKNMLSKTEQNVNRKSCVGEEELKKADISTNNVESISNGVNNSKSQIKSPIHNASDFTNSNTCNYSQQTMSKEEIEFLKKLSPSLKKRENMLCYFNVITKEDNFFDDLQNEINNSNNDSVIKVKFPKKNKRREKPIPVNNTIEVVSDITEIQNENNSLLKTNETSKRQKRKRKKHVIKPEPAIFAEEITVETRPKRNIKKPIKYEDSVLSDSSDEDLHIFTPKKKKNIASKLNSSPSNKNDMVDLTVKSIDQTVKNCLKPSNHSRNSFKTIQDKKPSKLAPIFKAKTNVEEQRAKQNFLHSGIPSHLKKSLSQPVVTTYFDFFHKVVHVQQISLTNEKTAYVHDSTLCLSSSDSDLNETNMQPFSFKHFLTHDSKDCNNVQATNDKIDTLLSIMKQSYSKFPVYRTYHLLKAKSRGEFWDTSYGYLDNSIEIVTSIMDNCNNSPDKFKWTDKYKATSSNQLIGNFESVKELKKWLISWTETDVAKNDSDSSDFYHSDTDSGDAIRMRNNLLILTGKTGSGKTSCVYTVAMELSIKVIEVNASSKRTGKIMLQDLQEATQSHKVDRQRDFNESSQKSIDKDINMKKNPKQKLDKGNKQAVQKYASAKKNTNSEQFSSQESVRTVMSLILIDDADIVFDQDEGFCSAISQLIHSSKRPVILVTETLKCPHLQKFLKYSKVINLNPLQPKMLGTWLDIMCLAENNTCFPGLGAKLLDYFQGDIRKSINCLQYYMTSQKYIIQKENISEDLDIFDGHDNDESSSMSWAVNENHEEKLLFGYNIYDSNIQYFMSKLLNLQLHSPSLTFNAWWSLPNLLSFNLNKPEAGKSKKAHITELDAVANAVDVFSTIDLLETTTSERYNIATKPWVSPERDSLVENENFNNYNIHNEIGKNISHHMMTSGLVYAQNILNCQHKTELEYPSMTLQRDRDKLVGRHKKLSSFLSPSVVLDRKAVSLDYWAYCRSICRVERAKTDSKNKRNNRFCHYLKSLNIVCKNDYYDELCKSLNANDTMNMS